MVMIAFFVKQMHYYLTPKIISVTQNNDFFKHISRVLWDSFLFLHFPFFLTPTSSQPQNPDNLIIVIFSVLFPLFHSSITSLVWALIVSQPK